MLSGRVAAKSSDGVNTVVRQLRDAMGLSQVNEMASLRQVERKEGFLDLLREKQRLEEEIATLENGLPENVGMSIRPVLKVGKDNEDYLREEIARKKENLKEVVERMKR